MITPHLPSPDPNQSTNRPEDRAAETRERLQGMRHPEVEMAEGLARDNYRFVNSPIGLELAIGIAIVAVVMGAIAVRLFVFG